MKVYDFSKHDLIEMPMIKETSPFEYILDNNMINQIENIPMTCAKLSITNNKISYISNKLQQDTQLKIFDVSFNRIISLSSFGRLQNLVELNLSNNYISDEQLVNLSSLIKLKNLNLSNNNLKNDSIVKVIPTLKSIEKITLSYNNIETIAFTNCKNETLSQIELDSNKISSISFQKGIFPKLIYLSLNENKISKLDSLSSLESLEYVSLNDNEILTIATTGLKSLKMFQMKSNMVGSFTIEAHNTKLAFVEMSYNNLSQFTILGNSNIKNLIIDNNKISNLQIASGAAYPTEEIDMSFNFVKNCDFVKHFPKLRKLNLSFNQLGNLGNVLRILSELTSLTDLSLVENDFNRNIYNIDVVLVEVFNSLEDYFKHKTIMGANRDPVIRYRNAVIKELKTLNSLDMIMITEEESGERSQNNFLQSNLVLNHNATINQFSGNFHNNGTIEQRQSTTRNTCGNTGNEDVLNNFKDTLNNIADVNGFISYKDFCTFCGEMIKAYEISKWMNDIIIEMKNITKASLLPGRFHIKEAVKVISSKNYDEMFSMISKKIKNNPSLSKSIKISQTDIERIQQQINNNLMNKNKDSINTNTSYQLRKKSGVQSDSGSKAKQQQSRNQNQQRNYTLLNTLLIKSPLLTQDEENEDLAPSRSHRKIGPKCFNILYQSSSELEVSPDLNNKLFLKDFLYFINHVSFFIKPQEASSSYIITIPPEEKEYKFIKSFLSNFSIENFGLQKWYCHEYYAQCLNEYETFDYLLEHNFLFFYSHYNEIIDNFINDVYHITDCFLLIEENPTTLITEETDKIVMYILVRNGNGSSPVDNIVYNQRDDKFYFHNPFDWINKENSTNNILIPIYIITLK